MEVFRVTCGSERVRDGRASDAVPDLGYERDGDVAHDASFPVAFAARDGGERGLLYCTCTCTCRPYEKGVVRVHVGPTKRGSSLTSHPMGIFRMTFLAGMQFHISRNSQDFVEYSKVLIDRVMG